MASVEPTEPQDVAGPHAEDDDERETPWGWFGGGAIALAIAVACFTPLWDEVADGSSGRRAGFAALLGSIGPSGVAGIALVVAIVFVALGVREMRSQRR
ncbi:hypothetical protein ASE14_12380 [Agromyces sp. Root81]|uniref:hypothetical protein n=1 Tax=Agromyces sp. Root81 TaxID=1736601 RepID=UPI0007000F01|nr:hypothetical protein [Agromyces sp. Root81]KRC61632.1 hypothetical protein ASE14_12380 [Agromyces sp. Root81]